MVLQLISCGNVLGYELVVTERSGHCADVVRTTPDLKQRYLGLVAVSGDGLLYEVVLYVFHSTLYSSFSLSLSLSLSLSCSKGPRNSVQSLITVYIV